MKIPNRTIVGTLDRAAKFPDGIPPPARFVYAKDRPRDSRRANGDTFHVTNCSPQRSSFNRAPGIWGGLENFIGAQSDTERLCVFAAPILAARDKVFSGTHEIKLPSRSWKVACAVKNGKLQVFAFVIEQNVKDLLLEFQVGAEWKHKQVPLKKLESLVTLVEFPKVYHDADQA